MLHISEVLETLFWFVVYSCLQNLEQDKIQDLQHEIYIKQSRVTLDPSYLANYLKLHGMKLYIGNNHRWEVNSSTLIQFPFDKTYKVSIPQDQ